MKKIYIWGTGREAEKCISCMDLQRCEVLGYIETNPQKISWRDRRVYSMSDLPGLQYDYLVIATVYYQEILDAVMEKRLADHDKIINWIKAGEYIGAYPEIRTLFLNSFWGRYYYVFDKTPKCSDKKMRQVSKDLLKYSKIFLYDLRLIDCEFDIVALMSEILDKKKSNAGMAFIPNESYLDENWYHNLIRTLDKNAFVIWRSLESIYAECMRTVPEKFSYENFSALQIDRRWKKVVKKGRYMLFDTTQIFRDKQEEIDGKNRIEIHCLWSERIGEEIRVLNKLLLDNHPGKDVFELYVTADSCGRQSDGSNACFDELVGRRVNLLRNKEEYAFWIQDIFDKSEKYKFCGLPTVEHLDIFKIEKREPIIDFNHEELEAGERLLKDNLNISGDYVCLFTRDREYLNHVAPHVNWSYHDYRDSSFEVMDKAIDYFDDCGIQTVRAGQIAEQREIHEKCINFANQEYDEFIDLMLHRNCKFFLGSMSGICEISHIFGKPVAALAPFYPQIQVSLVNFPEDLIIFNRMFDVHRARELSFLELFQVGIEFTGIGEYFAEHGLKMIPFSQEDVLDVAIEMNEKLDGTWNVQDKDAELHDRFDKLLKKAMEKYNMKDSRIYQRTVATSFLRRYEYLLDDCTDMENRDAE